MKQVKKLIVTTLVLALICPAPSANAAKKTTGYTVSKKSGTYETSFPPRKTQALMWY